MVWTKMRAVSAPGTVAHQAAVMALPYHRRHSVGAEGALGLQHNVHVQDWCIALTSKHQRRLLNTVHAASGSTF